MERFCQLHRYAALYLMCAFLTLFVLGMDTYFDMEEYKCAAAYGICVLGGGAFVLGIPAIRGLFSRKWGASVWWAFLCLASAVLSQSLAADAHNALWGLNGYYMGTALSIALLLLYMMLRIGGSGQVADIALLMFAISGLLVDFLAIINLYGVDPLQVTSLLVDYQQGVYFTTIGQKDFVALFLVLWYAVCVGGYVYSEGSALRPLNLLRFFCCFSAFWSMMLVNSDAYLLGAGVILLGIICVKDFSFLRLMRLFHLGILFWLAAFFAVHLAETYPTAQRLPDFGLCGRPVVAAVGIVVSCVGIVVLAAYCREHGRADRSLFHIGRAFTAALFVVFTAGFCLCTFALHDLPLKGVLRHLRFDEAWGTNRGAVWTALWRIVRQGDPIHLLLGYGSCSTHALLSAHPEVQQDIHYDLGGFYAAHNEYLEMLLGNGLLGLVSWLGLCLSSLREGLRRAGEQCIPLCLALLAYLAVAVVNIRTCMVFPVMMVLLGCLGAAAKEEQPQPISWEKLMLEAGVIMLAVAATFPLWQLIGCGIVPLNT